MEFKLKCCKNTFILFKMLELESYGLWRKPGKFELILVMYSCNTQCRRMNFNYFEVTIKVQSLAMKWVFQSQNYRITVQVSTIDYCGQKNNFSPLLFLSTWPS